VTLAFAAGAMLFVISHEMVPESHRSGNEGFATGGLLAGLAGMLILASALA
jgi:ZIP family zinc transporter